MKNLLIMMSILFFSVNAFSQKTKAIKIGDRYNWEEYSVLKSDRDIKHGLYKKFIYRKIVAKGNYDHGKKVGTWYYGESRNSYKEITYQEDLYTVKEANNDFIKEYTCLNTSKEILNGPYKDYINEQLYTTGNYEIGLKEGLWIFFNNGQKFLETEYADNIPQVDRVYKEDTLVSTVKFINGLKEGEVIINFGNGKPNYINTFKNDKLEGTSVIYNRKGELINKTDYSDGKKNGVVEKYKDNELIDYAEYQNDTLNGTIKSYYDNGILMNEIAFEKGVPFNVIEANTYDGKSNNESQLKEGTGRILMYSKDGELKKDYQYLNSKLNGKQTTYHTNGKVGLIEFFVNGVPNGTAESYNDEGALVFKGKVENGLKVGNWLNRGFREPIKAVYSAEEEVEYKYETNIGSVSLTTTIFSVVEEMPEYPNGMTGLSSFLRENITYPEMEKVNDIQGTSYVSFVVDQRGYITDVRIYEGTENKGTQNMHDESIRVVSIMPRWKPGFQRGVSVKVYYVVPIRYLLR